MQALDRKLIFPFMVFISLLPHEASGQEYYFKNIGKDQGLPSSETYSVIQDKKGYIWISSDGGVCRNNGTSLELFTTSNGLTNNTVFCQVGGKDGRIWFGGFDRSICFYKDGKLQNTECGNKLSKLKSKSNAIIIDIYEDEEENLWIATMVGLYKSHKATGYSDLEKVISGSEQIFVKVVIIDNRKAMMDLGEPAKQIAQSIMADSVVKINVIDQNVTRSYYVPGKQVLSLGSGRLFRTLLLSDGQLIIGTPSHLLIFDKSKISYISLPGHTLALYQDDEGGVWAGISKNGVLYFSNGNLLEKPIQMLRGSSVTSILEDHESGLWMSTLNQGVWYNPGRKFMIINGEEQKLKQNIYAIDTAAGQTWIGTLDGTLYNLDESFMLEEKYKELCHSGTIYGVAYINNQIVICQDKKSLFVGSGSTPVAIRDRQNLFWIPRNIVSDQTGNVYGHMSSALFLMKGPLLDNLVNIPEHSLCIIAAEGSGVLVGTLKGLYKYTGDTFDLLGRLDPLLGARIDAIKKDRRGIFWMASKERGVIAWNGDRIIQFDDRDGLPTNVCTDVEVDISGNIWVGTKAGLGKITINGDPFKNEVSINAYHTWDGLPSDEIHCLGSYGTKVLIGTSAGLAVTGSRIEEDKLVCPPVYFSEISLSGLSCVGKSNFQWNHNDLSCHVNGLTFKGTDGPRFIFELKGEDSLTKELQKGEFYYSSLDPGNYTVSVYAVNVADVRSCNAASVSFTIEKPFWSRPMALIGYCFVVAGSLLSVVRWHDNRTRRREEEKTRISKLVTEYKLTAIRAQMNPHFIFNAINSIQSFILGRDEKQAYDYLTSFSKLIRNVLENSDKNHISLANEMETLRLYVSLEKLRFGNRFEFEFRVDPDINAERIFIPVMLIQPFVENSIWHGIMPMRDSVKGSIEVRIKRSMEFLIIEIEDNGIGRALSAKSKDHKRESFGMLLNKQRMELFRSSTEVIDLHSERDVSLGTLVRLRYNLNEQHLSE